jgi:hypothetical protein
MKSKNVLCGLTIAVVLRFGIPPFISHPRAIKTTWPILLGLLLLAAPAAVRAQYTYTNNADGVSITITGYTGHGGAVTIPTNINNRLVTSIGDYAFEQAAVTSVTIPGSVTNISPASAIMRSLSPST